MDTIQGFLEMALASGSNQLCSSTDHGFVSVGNYSHVESWSFFFFRGVSKGLMKQWEALFHLILYIYIICILSYKWIVHLISSILCYDIIYHNKLIHSQSAFHKYL